MKTAIVRRIGELVLSGLIIIGLLTIAFVSLHAEAGPPAKTDSSFTKDLIGTWSLVRKPVEGQPREPIGRIKFFTGRHWTLTQYDVQTGVTIYNYGGTYKVDGTNYVEVVDYANQNTAEHINKKTRFIIKVDGNTLTETKVGSNSTQTWKRLN